MTDATATLIKMEGVKKVFYTDEVETHALSEIHLEIKKGQYISIAGPSGCGKSTLLSILGLLDSPTGGEYTLNGQPVANLSISERTRIRNREIGFIFQAFNLIGDLTVYENVELPLTYRGTSAAERKQKVQHALERVGMAHRLRHYPSQLSGGQQQRVAVARALVGDPLILMADEPTGNLDSKNGEAVMELLRDLHRNGATVCMVTHDQRYANFAERTIHLFDGRIVEETQERASELDAQRPAHGNNLARRSIRVANVDQTPDRDDRLRGSAGSGIGANTAIFSLAEAFLLHPVPFENSDRIVALVDARAASQDAAQVRSPGPQCDCARDVSRLEKRSTFVR